MSWIPGRHQRSQIVRDAHARREDASNAEAHARSGPRQPLSGDLKHRIAEVLFAHGRIDEPVRGRVPVMRCRFVRSVVRKAVPMDCYEIETRVQGHGHPHRVVSMVELSGEGEVHLVAS